MHLAITMLVAAAIAAVGTAGELAIIGFMVQRPVWPFILLFPGVLADIFLFGSLGAYWVMWREMPDLL